MAFTESNKVQVRRWLGYSPADLDQLRIINSAMTLVQSTGDGGQMPDNTTETAITGWLTQLASIETAVQALYDQSQVLDADDASLDAARGQAVLARSGRMYVGFIADALNVSPKRDVFIGKILAGLA